MPYQTLGIIIMSIISALFRFITISSFVFPKTLDIKAIARACITCLYHAVLEGGVAVNKHPLIHLCCMKAIFFTCFIIAK